MRRADHIDVRRHVGDESLDDVAAFQQPWKLCDLLDTLASDCACRSNKLHVLGGSDVLDRAAHRPCRVREGSLRLPRTGRVPQRPAERLSELRVDFALPVLAEVDFRNRRTRRIREATAENAAPIASGVRGHRRS